jgi:hypothetical protein
MEGERYAHAACHEECLDEEQRANDFRYDMEVYQLFNPPLLVS